MVNDLVLKSKETLYDGKIEDRDGDQNLPFKVIDNILHNNGEPQLPSHNSLDELVNKFVDYFTEKIESIREKSQALMQWILFLMMKMLLLVLNCHLSNQLVKMRCACLYHDPAINHVVWIPSMHS